MMVVMMMMMMMMQGDALTWLLFLYLIVHLHGTLRITQRLYNHQLGGDLI